MSDATRTLLGKRADAFSRESVYELPDGLETESREGYDVSLRRVLFEDVLLVTYHRELGRALVIAMAIVAAVFIGMGVVLRAMGEGMAALWIGVFSLPFLSILIFRLIFRVDVVSVFGRRSKASLHFAVRKQRAREIYDHICERVAAAQRRMDDEIRHAGRTQEEPAVAAEMVPNPFGLPEEEGELRIED
jgi:hypothetical protein